MVLNRLASNYVQKRTRRSRDSEMNENEDSTAKATSRDLKSVRTRSSTIVRARERRSRMTGGVKGKLQRVKDDKKHFDHVQRTRTPPTRTSIEARPSSNPLPQSSHEQNGNEVVAEIEMASTDTRDQEPERYSVHQLKSRLDPPAFQEVTAEQLVAVDPSLQDVPPPYVRDTVEAIGSALLDGLVRSNIKGFDGVNENDPRLPARVVVERPENMTLEPSHAFAVHSKPNSPDDKIEVSLQLGYSLLLAAHCSKLPPLPPSSASEELVTHEDERGKFARYTLGITPLRVPSAKTFPILVSYLCNLDEQRLLSILLGVPPPSTEPVQLPTPASSPPYLIQSVVDVEYLTSEVHNMSVQLAALHAGNCASLLLKLQRVWNLYRNAVSLGVFESGLWSTMQTAWSTLLLATEITSKAGGVPINDN